MPATTAVLTPVAVRADVFRRSACFSVVWREFFSRRYFTFVNFNLDLKFTFVEYVFTDGGETDGNTGHGPEYRERPPPLDAPAGHMPEARTTHGHAHGGSVGDREKVHSRGAHNGRTHDRHTTGHRPNQRTAGRPDGHTDGHRSNERTEPGHRSGCRTNKQRTRTANSSRPRRHAGDTRPDTHAGRFFQEVIMRTWFHDFLRHHGADTFCGVLPVLFIILWFAIMHTIEGGY